MSLLHKALKKAERDRNVSPEGGVVDSAEHDERGVSRSRVYILVSLVFVSALVLAYVRLWKTRGDSPPVASSIPSAVNVGDSSGNKTPAVNAVDSLEVDRLLQQKRWTEAKTLLEKMLLQEPRNPELYSNLAMTYRQTGDLAQAEQQYQKALLLQADFPEALNNLGVVYLAKRQLTDAAVNFQKALSLRPDYAEPHFHLALLAESEGKIDEAKQHYSRYIELVKGADATFLLKVQQRMASLGGR